MSESRPKHVRSSIHPWVGLAARLAVRLAIVSIPLVTILYAVKVWTKVGYTDFEVYYRAATQFTAGQYASIYRLDSGASPFRYGPWNLPLFAPLALLRFEVARLVWYFLNLAGFAAGFFFLDQMVRQMVRQMVQQTTAQMTPAQPERIFLALSYLGVLRFMLDSFTIGQVTGILFAALALATESYVLRRSPGRVGFGIFIPASLKLGGIIQAVFPVSDALCGSGNRNERLRQLAHFSAGFVMPFALLSAIAFLWIGPSALPGVLETYRAVSGTTFQMPGASDIAGLNAHYGSQSILSALLRLSFAGWISFEAAKWIWIASGVAAALGLVFLVSRGETQASVARLRLWSLGVLFYLLWMPFQFKYGYPLLAIPVLALLMGMASELGKNSCSRTFTRVALVFGVFSLSLAGLDIYGETLFFGLQRASIPVVAVLLITAALVKQIWSSANSRPPGLSKS